MLKQREFNLKQQRYPSKHANTKYKPNTLMINHFIIKRNLHGHPAQTPLSCVTFHDVIVSILKVKYQLKHFYINTKFDGLLGEIDTVIQNVEFNLTMSAKYSQRVQIFLH